MAVEKVPHIATQRDFVDRYSEKTITGQVGLHPVSEGTERRHMHLLPDEGNEKAYASLASTLHRLNPETFPRGGGSTLFMAPYDAGFLDNTPNLASRQVNVTIAGGPDDRAHIKQMSYRDGDKEQVFYVDPHDMKKMRAAEVEDVPLKELRDARP